MAWHSMAQGAALNNQRNSSSLGGAGYVHRKAGRLNRSTFAATTAAATAAHVFNPGRRRFWWCYGNDRDWCGNLHRSRALSPDQQKGMVDMLPLPNVCTEQSLLVHPVLSAIDPYQLYI